jgi:hypothetical protein
VIIVRSRPLPVRVRVGVLEYALSLARDLAHSWPRGPHQYYLCATPPSIHPNESHTDYGKEKYYPLPERLSPDDIRRRADQVKQRLSAKRRAGTTAAPALSSCSLPHPFHRTRYRGSYPPSTKTHSFRTIFPAQVFTLASSCVQLISTTSSHSGRAHLA